MRVLDLSRLLPGPYCSRILVDYGFEVIKIEPPGGGDWSRHVPPLDPGTGQGLLFNALNRGKKSLTANLKTDEGRAILLQLAETADVLLESFRPGVMDRLGLGYETLAHVNSQLVYCSLSGYGPTGPYRERAGHDLNYQGLAGLLDLTGPREGTPAMPGVPLADLSGALWAATGILMALLERERSGRGQRVDSSLLGGALSLLPLAVAQVKGGQPPVRGAGELSGGVVCYNLYATRDGATMAVSALEPQFWSIFCQATGREDLAGEQYSPAVPGEPAYDELCALFGTRTRQEWQELFSGIDACCDPVYNVEEALASDPVRALEMLGEEGLRPPVQFSRQPVEAGAPAPLLGEHTAAILTELGYDTARVEELQELGVV
ncbi:MAG: CoA transferase [Anaerolineae bacterium]|nr:CoA transferase [Anaerolineae bacterium]